LKTVRIRGKIKEFLKDESKNTIEILDYLNNHFRHGTSIWQLINVLSKDKDITKVGNVSRKGIVSGTYNICEWALKENIAMT